MQLTMKSAMMILSFCTATLADQCASGSTEDGGNFYCQPVKAIQYSNVGHSGSYNKVTSMTGGACSSEPQSYTGSLAPLDEELSLHFRGPMQLKKVAAYSKSGGSSKREVPGPHSRRHGHEAFHKRQEKRADMVTATIDGKVVSWENNYFGAAATGAPDAGTTPAAGTPAAASTAPASTRAAVVDTPIADAVKGIVKNVKAAASGDSTGAYSRTGYYDSESQTLDGLTFLGNYGGQGSGVFDNNYGMSLSYLSSDGASGASSSTVLSDTKIASNNEFAIFSDKECSGDDCGYVRPGTVAYHGFGGADKVFLFEFSMPHDGDNGFNGDMPAIWMLNAQIPRTLQYGDASCSCWESGCGEFDIVEVLSPGDDRCKSTLHTNNAGGSSDYIKRPTSGTMQLAVIFDSADGTANIQVLPDGTDFASSLSADQVSSFLKSATGSEVSEFSIAA